MLPQLRVGDTVDFNTEQPAHQGRSLSIALVGPQTIIINGSEIGTTGNFAFNVSSAVTAAWTAGLYFWTLLSVLGGERITVDSGSTQILPDITLVAAPLDMRSHAGRMLDAIEAILEGRIVKDAESYMIRGRSLTRIPMPELMTLRDKYRAEVLRQEQAAGIVPVRNKLRVTFAR